MPKVAKKIKDEKIDRVYANKSDTEIRIAQVAKNTIDYAIKHIFPEAYEIIKQKVLFSADIEYQIKKLVGDSNMGHKIYPLIDPIHVTFVDGLKDTEVSAYAVPRRDDAIDLTEQANALYDWAITKSDIKKQEEIIGAEAALLGTSFAQFGSSKEETFDSITKGLDEQDPTVTNIPSCLHISFFELFAPPDTVDFKKTRYKYRRKLLTCTQIRELYPFINWNEKKETLHDGSVERYEFIERTCGEALYKWDFNRIWKIKDYENVYKEHCQKNNLDRGIFDENLYSNMFNVVKNDNGIHEVLEYWAGKNLVIMINGYIHYDGDNPYGAQDPFACIVYEQLPGTFRGRGIGQKLMSLQKEANMLSNSVNNGIKMHLFPDYAITKGFLSDANGGEVTDMKWQGGKVYEIKQGNVLTGEPFKAIHFMDKDVLVLADRRLQEIRAEAQDIIGTNSYTQGGQGKVERAAAGVNTRVAVTRSRLGTIVNSLNEFRARGFYLWTYIMAASYPKGLKVRILGEDKSAAFIDIKNPADILNKFDMVVERETAVSIRRAEVVSNTIQILNGLAPYVKDADGMDTFDVGEVISKLLNNATLENFEPLSLEKMKAKVDKQFALEKYKSEKVAQLQGPIPQGGGTQPTREQITNAAASIPPRGINATQEQMAELGM